MPNTPNFDLEKPSYGATHWDVPVNSNWDKLDAHLHDSRYVLQGAVLPNGWINVGAVAGLTVQAPNVSGHQSGSVQTANRVALQGAIDALPMGINATNGVPAGGTLLMPQGRICIDTKLDLSFDVPGNKRRSGITMTGPGSLGSAHIVVPPTTLCFHTTGSGVCMDLASGQATVLQDLGVVYTSSSFTGTLISTNKHTGGEQDSTDVVINRCLVYTDSQAYVHTAAAGIDFANSIFAKVIDCHIGSMQRGVTNSGGYSNGVGIFNTDFDACTVAAITNPAQAWVIDNCGFEGLIGGPGVGMSRALYDERPADSLTEGLTFSNNWMGDTALNPTTWVSNGQAAWSGVKIFGNFFADVAAGVTGIKLGNGSCHGWSIAGNDFETQTGIDFDDTSTDSGPRDKRGILVAGNNFISGTTSIANLHTAGTGQRGNFHVFANNYGDSFQEVIKGPIRFRSFYGTDSAFFADHNGDDIMKFNELGQLQWVAAAQTQTTVGAAGGASAPPATPKRWLKVVDTDGTVLVIPAYLAS